MRTEHINYFIHVVHCKSIRLASTELFISPQGLSQAIQQLEKEMGTPLFTRNNNRLSLTPAGQKFYEFALEINGSMQKLKEDLNDITQGKNQAKKDLTIYSTFHIGSTLLPQIANTFQAQNPNITVRILESDLNILDDVMTRDIDWDSALMLYSLPEQRLPEFTEQLPDTLQFRPILSSSIMALVSFQSPLAQMESITPEDLASHPLVIYSNGDVFLDIYGVPYNEKQIVLKSQNLDLCRSFVAQNTSAIHFTDQLAESFFHKKKKKSLVALPIQPEIRLSYGLVTAKSCQNQKLEELCDIFFKQFSILL